SYRLSDIDEAAKTFWKTAKKHKVIAFYAGMGAGKTTFITAVCRLLKVKETPVSPTFSIINAYQYTNGDGMEKKILHSDWYRIDSINEAIEAGIEDMFNQ